MIRIFLSEAARKIATRGLCAQTGAFRLRIWMVLGSILFLPSCALFEEPRALTQSPESRRQLAALDAWRIEGRVGVRRDDESWQASLVWEHFRDLEHLMLSGPFGQGAFDIEFTQQHIRITHADGKIEESSDPQSLLESALGFSVPVAAFRYWILGLEYPSEVFDSEHDPFGKLMRVKQLGWECQYQEYQSVLNFSIPKKLSVLNAKTRLKLVIDEWSISERYQ